MKLICLQLCSIRVRLSDSTERLHFQFSLSRIGEGNGNPLQGSCLENPRDCRAWWAAIYGVAQSRTRLKRVSMHSHTTIHLKEKQSSHVCKKYVFICEKAMAPHSSTLAWRIPRMEEPGGLQSTGSLRVGHNRETSLSLFPFKHWRRKCQSTPGFLPGESQGQRSLVGCRLWGHTESDTTEVT